VVVHTESSTGKRLQADGIEVAGKRLHERSLSCSPRLFQCAITNAVLVVASEYAVFSIDNGSHVIAIDVFVRDALPVDEGAGFQGEIVPDGGQRFFQFGDFLAEKGRTAFAFHATDAFAFAQVAAELLFENIEADECIVDFYHDVLVYLIRQ